MAFNTRTFTEKKAALNLAYFAKHHPDIALSGDRIQSLVNTLVVSQAFDYSVLNPLTSRCRWKLQTR